MLVLSRREGQSLTLFHNGVQIAEVEMHRINGNRVTVCIDAPDAVRVVRTELLLDQQPEPRPA